MAGVSAAALLVASCGGSGADGDGDAYGVGSTPTEAADGATTRTVEHVVGTAEVPVEPQRVATTSEVIAGHLVSVGVVPVAGPTDVDAWLQPYVDAGLVGDPDLDSIADVGLASEVNREALVAARPDLIVVDEGAAAGFDDLDAIAPTVVVELPTTAAWQTAFDQTVAAAGAEEAAEDVRSRYDALLDEVPDTAGDTLVTFLRGRGEGVFRIDGLGGFGGSVAEEAGYAVDIGDVSEEVARQGPIEYSNERLDVVAGDLLVTTARRGDEPSSIQALLDGPLWDSIPAVQQDRILELPQPVYNGGTYVAAELLLQSLVDAT